MKSVKDWIVDLKARITDRLKLHALGQLLPGPGGALDVPLSAGFANSSSNPNLACHSDKAQISGIKMVGHDDQPPGNRTWNVIYESPGEVKDPQLPHCTADGEW